MVASNNEPSKTMNKMIKKKNFVNLNTPEEENNKKNERQVLNNMLCANQVENVEINLIHGIIDYNSL